MTSRMRGERITYDNCSFLASNNFRLHFPSGNYSLLNLLCEETRQSLAVSLRVEHELYQCPTHSYQERCERGRNPDREST